MLEVAMTAPTGDDVLNEDPTVHLLQDYMAELFGKPAALFVPTGTMANLIALLSHCHGRASEILVGANSHINLWEGGNVANLGGIYARQLQENEHTAQYDFDDVRNAIRADEDDHFAHTKVVCVENTHNVLGGVALDKTYINDLGALAKSLNVKLHVDGARIFNASAFLNESVKDLCQAADSVSVCLSKGLGAPLGSVLLGDEEFIRLAKRARKRCGGGMRQAGVVASMGLYALQHNVEKLKVDHERAARLANELVLNGFRLGRHGTVETNMFFFRLPLDSVVSKDEYGSILSEKFNVKISGGYNKGGEMFRVVTHMDLVEEDISRAAEALIQVARGL
jgi:threonine aldolase